MRGSLTVQPPLFSQEADLSVVIAAHEADNDCLLFSALEAVDAAELYAREALLERRKQCQLLVARE